MSRQHRHTIRMADAAMDLIAADRAAAQARANFEESCRRAVAAGVPKTKLADELSAVFALRGAELPRGFGCSSLRNIIDRG